MKPKLAPSRYLYYYRCFRCTTWAVTAGDVGRSVRCNGACGGYKAYKHRELLTSDPHDQELWDYATQHGVAHLPIPNTSSRPCHRCGETFEPKAMRYHQMFWVCKACYDAAVPPPPPPQPITQDIIDAANAAHKAREKKHREYELFGQETAFTGNTGE